jgi:hypothetical protein
MRSVTSSFAGALLLVASTGAMAQSAYDDQACRQYADAQTAALRNQANSQAVGSTLLGAGLGAALGGAIGGGRGAGIGAASGAVLGGGAGVANAQNTQAYAQQQYNAYYSQCMAARTSPPPVYNAPPAAYAPGSGYAQPPVYAPSPGYAQPPAYPPSSGYSQQPAYPPNTAYTQPPAYAPYPGYAPQR